jgi:Predicted membrane protein
MANIKELMEKYREAILYVVCGGFTTALTLLSYALFVWLGMEHNISNILSWTCGILFAFVVNKWIVFNSKCLERSFVMKEFVSFVGSRIFTGIIAFVMFPILYTYLIDQSLFGIEYLPAKIITVVVEIALNWILSKYYVFKRKPETKYIDT